MTLPILLDAVFVVLMTLAKAGMVFGLVYALARSETELSFRKCLAVALIVEGIFAINKTGTDLQAIGMAVAVAALVGAVAVRFAFDLDWGQSLLIGGLATAFSIGAGMYSVRLLDETIPGRPSIAGDLIETLDGFVRSQSGNVDAAPSESLAQAMYGAIQQFVGGTVAGGVTGQVRAGMETVNKVEALQAGAGKRVDFIDSLSESGMDTPLGDDAYDMARQMEDSAEEAQEQAAEAVPDSAPAMRPPPAAATTPDSVAGDPSLNADDTGTMVLRNRATADPDIHLSSDQVVDILRDLTPEDRRTWAAAQEQLTVRSTLKYRNGKSAAIVNGHVVEPGGIVSVTIAEELHAYQLVSVGSDEVYWTPVRADGSADQRKLLRTTF